MRTACAARMAKLRLQSRCAAGALPSDQNTVESEWVRRMGGMHASRERFLFSSCRYSWYMVATISTLVYGANFVIASYAAGGGASMVMYDGLRSEVRQTY